MVKTPLGKAIQAAQAAQENIEDKPYAVAIRKANAIDASLRSTDKRFNELATVACRDGSVFHVHHGFIEEWKDKSGMEWIFLFPEHYPCMVFAKEDVLSWSAGK